MSKRLTTQAHELVAAALGAGEIVVDATVGNGYDTLFLAQTVGASGHVFGFDVQAPALACARRRLRAADVQEQVTLFCASHTEMCWLLPADLHGRLGAVMFNLGYLPGSDHARTTCAGTTVPALASAWSLLRPGGRLSIVTYRGHPGGGAETAAVLGWMRKSVGRMQVIDAHPFADAAPLLVWCER